MNSRYVYLWQRELRSRLLGYPQKQNRTRNAFGPWPSDWGRLSGHSTDQPRPVLGARCSVLSAIYGKLICN